MKPVVSIVLCTYSDGEPSRDVLRALESVRRQQTLVPYEVILVVDSPSQDLLAAVRAVDGSVLVAARSTRTGIAPSRWRGVLAAQGDFVAFIDDDCVANDDWLEGYLRVFDGSPSIVFAGGRTFSLDDASLMSRFCEVDATQATPLLDPAGQVVSISTVNAFARREAILAVRGFATGYKTAAVAGLFYGFEDFDLTQRLRRRYGTASLAYVPGAVVFHQHRRGWRRRMAQVRWYGESAAFWCWTYSMPCRCLAPAADLPAVNSIGRHVVRIARALPRYLQKVRTARGRGLGWLGALLFGIYAYSLRCAFHVGYHAGWHHVRARLGQCGSDDAAEVSVLASGVDQCA